MRRIVLLGSPGAGKSTFAQVLVAELGIAHIELDHLWHRPGWDHASPEQFQSDLQAAIDAARDGWVTDGNYNSRADEVRLPAADTVIWLDLPRRIVMRRVIVRTFRRALRRETLFGHDLREPWSNFYRWDPEKNIIRWTWVKFYGYRQKYEQMSVDGTWSHLAVHRLRTAADVAELLEGVRSASQ